MSICVADVWLGNDIIVSFTDLTEQGARRLAWRYCRNTQNHGAVIKTYWNLSDDDL